MGMHFFLEIKVGDRNRSELILRLLIYLSATVSVVAVGQFTVKYQVSTRLKHCDNTSASTSAANHLPKHFNPIKQFRTCQDIQVKDTEVDMNSKAMGATTKVDTSREVDMSSEANTMMATLSPNTIEGSNTADMLPHHHKEWSALDMELQMHTPSNTPTVLVVERHS